MNPCFIPAHRCRHKANIIWHRNVPCTRSFPTCRRAASTVCASRRKCKSCSEGMVLHPSVKNNFGDTNPPLADCSCILSIAILIFERIVTPKNARMNILLIEDDKMLLRMLTKNLEDHGHRVFGAGDGREAVDLALENEVDAIVCDLMMPVISGVTFLHSREKF